MSFFDAIGISASGLTAERVRMDVTAENLANAETTEGAVQAYIHANHKIGAIVEVDCQTDFVARNEKFVEFARDVALHVAAATPLAISEADVPAEDEALIAETRENIVIRRIARFSVGG